MIVSFGIKLLASGLAVALPLTFLVEQLEGRAYELVKATLLSCIVAVVGGILMVIWGNGI